MRDRIEKEIVVNAGPERVWAALTDYREFGTWFRVRLEGPFAVGQVTRGVIVEPGYEGMAFWVIAAAMETPSRFAFDWPCQPDARPEDAGQPGATARLEFRLEPVGQGTRVQLRKADLPAWRRDWRWPSSATMTEVGRSRWAGSRPMSMASPLVARQAAVFAALGDATRLHLVAQLDRAPSLSISTLAEGVRLTRQAVAKHLKVLEDAGIVVPAKIGREQRYAVRPAALAEADAYLRPWRKNGTGRWHGCRPMSRTMAVRRSGEAGNDGRAVTRLSL